jgi:hypothetical protein
MFGRVRYAKEASVLVRLDCRSGFNVGGLECLIITERTHGPWAMGHGPWAVLLMPCFLIVEKNSSVVMGLMGFAQWLPLSQYAVLMSDSRVPRGSGVLGAFSNGR